MPRTAASTTPPDWPVGTTRIPYRIFSEPDIFRREQDAIFAGRTWQFLCLAAEVPNPGDFKSTFLGQVPVVVTRGADRRLNALVNRCAHRGSLVCLKQRGNARALTCVYHAWSYSLEGDLTNVAFRRGVEGQGGMPAGFKMEEHGLKKLRVAEFCGLVFGSLSADVPLFEDYIGPEIAARIRRVLGRPLRVLGYNQQVLNNNWKLYIENNKDTYHASLLHLFFTTFRILRLSSEGGIVVDESGGHHSSYSRAATDRATQQYDGLRSNQSGYRLADPSLLDSVDEFGDGITVQILTIFPNFVLQQIQNSIAVRQILPKALGQTELMWTYVGFEGDDEALAMARLKQSNLVGPAGYISMEDGAVGGFIQRGIVGSEADMSVVEMGGSGHESQKTRATEAAVRGFWHAYRQLMGL